MHDSRNLTALQQLAGLGRDAGPPGWDWAIARLEPTGRLLLPVEACRALAASAGVGAEVRGVCHATVLVLTPAGGGRRMTIDRRRRLYVPVWLRRGHSRPTTRAACPAVAGSRPRRGLTSGQTLSEDLPWRELPERDLLPTSTRRDSISRSRRRNPSTVHKEKTL